MSWDDVPVATGRLIQKQRGYFASRIAVLKEYRGQGVGELRAVILLATFDLDIFRCDLALASDVIRHRLALRVQAKAALALAIRADPQIGDVVHDAIPRTLTFLNRCQVLSGV